MFALDICPFEGKVGVINQIANLGWKLLERKSRFGFSFCSVSIIEHDCFWKGGDANTGNLSHAVALLDDDSAFSSF
jgi:hypothetical protein